MPWAGKNGISQYSADGTPVLEKFTPC